MSKYGRLSSLRYLKAAGILIDRLVPPGKEFMKHNTEIVEKGAEYILLVELRTYLAFLIVHLRVFMILYSKFCH